MKKILYLFFILNLLILYTACFNDKEEEEILKVKVIGERKILNVMGTNYMNFETSMTLYYLHEMLVLDFEFFNESKDLIKITEIEIIDMNHKEGRKLEEYSYRIRNKPAELNVEGNISFNMTQCYCLEGGGFYSTVPKKEEHIDSCIKDLKNIDTITLFVSYIKNGKIKEKLLEFDIKDIEVMYK